MAELMAKLVGYEGANEKARVTNAEQWIERYSASWRIRQVNYLGLLKYFGIFRLREKLA